jgi:hypothetical protein
VRGLRHDVDGAVVSDDRSLILALALIVVAMILNVIALTLPSQVQVTFTCPTGYTLTPDLQCEANR